MYELVTKKFHHLIVGNHIFVLVCFLHVLTAKLEIDRCIGECVKLVSIYERIYERMINRNDKLKFHT